MYVHVCLAMTSIQETGEDEENSTYSTDSEPLNCTGYSTDLEPLNWSFSDHNNEDSTLLSSTPNKSAPVIGLLKPYLSPISSLPLSKMRKRRDPVDVLRTSCCTKKCMKTLSPLDIDVCELQFKEKNTTQQRQFILDSIRDKSQTKYNLSGKTSITNNFVLKGKSVCERAWCNAHDITYTRFLRCQRLFEIGTTVIHHGNLSRSYMHSKTTEALGWMKYLFERIGDWMPHKTQIHLPSTYTKKALYERMVKDFKEREVEQIISYEHFTSVWADHLPHCIISKGSEFTECSICTNLKERRNRVLTDFEHQQVTQMMREHTHQVEKERKEYQMAREMARRQPRDLTVIIIDGMDQAKTDVPHFIRRDKGSVHLARLPVHITGVLVHTGLCIPDNKIPLVYLDNKDIPHDSNLTINCLLKTLSLHQDKLGRSLFLQLDNCFRENKNRYVMAFAALLVELKVFEEVTMHFLPVGHTHEDVDQLFSCIAAKIRTDNVYTVDDLEARITDSFKPRINVQNATPVHDVKRWIEPHLYGDFKHHSHPHWFRFNMVDDSCRMHWKMWQSDMWEPRPEDNLDAGDTDLQKGLICLKSKPSLRPVPPWVKPCLEKMDVPALQRDILTNEGYLMRLPQSARTWWHHYLSNIMDKEQVPDTATVWPLEELQGLLNRHDEIEEEISPETMLIQNKLNRVFPKVSIGNQGKERRNHVTLEDSRDSVEVGQLVAIHLEDKTKRPYIGRVTQLMDSSVKLHWLKGSWMKEWKNWNLGNGKSAKPYVDEVSVQSVILWGFHLSRRGCLNTDTRSELKKKYTELDEKDA